MINSNNKSGFTAVELLVTLFIAAAFLMSGYQLFNVIIKDGGTTKVQSIASNVVYDYLQRYKTSVPSTCIARTPVDNQSITVSGLTNVTITVAITCPYSSTPAVSKTQVTLQYNNPQQTLVNTTYSTPSVNCPTGYIVVPGSATYGTLSLIHI